MHRDIKPPNIFLTQRGGIPDFVKVLDFGLVKARDMKGQVELTGANATLGTPLYMSPEAVGHPNAVDARSDLYSLGGGRLLPADRRDRFRRPERWRSDDAAGPRPAGTAIGPAERPVSADLEDLLMSCLAKNPAGAACQRRVAGGGAGALRRRRHVDPPRGAGMVEPASRRSEREDASPVKASAYA